ncbi:MAG: 4-hydroxy-3-methylbut-2-enyl diphosphate reductase [Coriobacteriia bacterium]|nr:4-hydroxy-3-methylbut-2-enyl diphosphate reductase [Coriobacteriia bacterium]
MKVIVARAAGVCYGVERALKLATEAATTGDRVSTLGPLIHNPQAVAALQQRGVGVASSLDDIDDGTVVIRSHGVDPAVIVEAEKRGLSVVDATCPFVRAAHTCAAELAAAGYGVVIVGESDHPEVEGILAHAGGEAVIVEHASDLPAKLPRRIGVVVQTTQQLSTLREVVDDLLPRTAELRVCNTICSATAKRQTAAAELADEVDVIVVVGGHNSGNTTRLTEICRARNPRTHHVETAAELRSEWFADATTVGVTAGASTPDEQIQGVIAAIESMPGDE